MHREVHGISSRVTVTLSHWELPADVPLVRCARHITQLHMGRAQGAHEGNVEAGNNLVTRGHRLTASPASSLATYNYADEEEGLVLTSLANWFAVRGTASIAGLVVDVDDVGV